MPVLELDDGTRLNSTAGIWNYLEAECPEPALLGTTPQEKGVIADLQWRIEIDGFFAMAELLRNSASRMKGRTLKGPSFSCLIPHSLLRSEQRGRFP